MADIQYYGTGRRKTSTARVYLRPGTGDIKVMFYSSSDTQELRKLAEQHGAQGFLTKTASTGELEFRVRELLGGPRSSKASQRLPRA